MRAEAKIHEDSADAFLLSGCSLDLQDAESHTKAPRESLSLCFLVF